MRYFISFSQQICRHAVISSWEIFGIEKLTYVTSHIIYQMQILFYSLSWSPTNSNTLQHWGKNVQARGHHHATDRPGKFPAADAAGACGMQYRHPSLLWNSIRVCVSSELEPSLWQCEVIKVTSESTKSVIQLTLNLCVNFALWWCP